MEVVKTEVGYVSGTALGDPDNPVHVYRGIPYAAPPMGDLRWKPPQSAAGPLPKATIPQSEDCLYLNVLTPAKEPSERLPVMVWMHGGVFSIWSGNDSLYNGLRLPLNGVVLVNINVRLGPLGFLAHPLLSKESPQAVSGNYSFLDFIAALKWVRENISAFGGDADNVTIFGESSGSAAVIYLMASPLAKGLFHRAIGESGPGLGGTFLKEIEGRGE
jgi:para-nitrobenzyl esterase